MLELAKQSSTLLQEYAAMLKVRRLAKRRQKRKHIIQSAEKLAQLMNEFMDEFWPKKIAFDRGQYLENKDLDDLLEQRSRMAQLVKRTPSIKDDLAPLLNAWERMLDAFLSLPRIDEEQLKASKRYFAEGGEGIDVRDILNDLPG